MMERVLQNRLSVEGITTHTMKVLEEEEIISLRTFSYLKKEHFEALSKKVKLGQHALLQRVWDKQVFTED